VLNDPSPFVFQFRVTNKSNSALAVQFATKFTDKPAWTQFATPIALDGTALSVLRLSPFNLSNPTDPAASAVVGVAVTTPSGANSGDTGTLQLKAFVPAPIDLSASDSRLLTVGTAATPPPNATLAFSSQSPVLSRDPSTLKAGDSMTLAYTFNFNVASGPTTRSVRFRYDISAPANPDSLFAITFGPSQFAVDPSASTTTSKVSLAFPMTSGDQITLTVTVLASPQAPSKSALTFVASVISVTDGIKDTRLNLTVSVP
jgi:hypothetical protein